ncbi:hypothetical protein LOTGIDRAFT_228526 [Lottia gigantea]|uniref:Peptidase C51 domain-containing protein n=1 Tax=Lottia gigantea TaxID=225164 RepID=V3ZQQ3_LOTGI|nr:hypothetical protein LOTGIDRAFT_228526 [Lottia gigantea]ESO93748.1 hypothetical protein LOTGIDRAFT_228526 [Lottia gigantea]
MGWGKKLKIQFSGEDGWGSAISQNMSQLYTMLQKKPVTGDMIASIAESYIGSEDWSIASSSGPGPGTYKAHLFIEDVIDQAGGSVPKKWLGIGGPISIEEWANPESPFLVDDENWKRVTKPKEGDVVTDGKHIGFITGYRTTTHPGKKKIKQDNWGFKPGQSIDKFIIWRYVN